MIPTITGLSNTSISSSKTPANIDQAFKDTLAQERAAALRAQNAYGVRVVERAANDASDRAYKETMARISSQMGGHNRTRPNAANENSSTYASNTGNAYANTMDRIMSKHNAHYATRPSATNDNWAFQEKIDSIVDRPEEPKGTMDEYGKLYGKKKKKGVDTTPPTGREAKKIEDSANPDNDKRGPRKKRKPIVIHEREDDGPGRDVTPPEMEDSDVERAIGGESGVDIADGGSDAGPISDSDTSSSKGGGSLLERIEENTRRSADGVDLILARITDANDGIGIDSLKAKEKASERDSRSRPSKEKQGSSRAQSDNSSNIGRLITQGLLGAGLTAGGSALGWLGSWFGGTGNGPDGGPPGGYGQNMNPDASPAPAAPGATSVTPAPTQRRRRGGGAPAGRGETIGQGVGYLPATALPDAVRADNQYNRDLRAGVTRLSRRFNLAEDDFYRLMAKESGFRTIAHNRRGRADASGLIQITRDTAATLGTNTAAIRRMGPAEQLRLAERYYQNAGLGRVRNPTLSDLYVSNFLPAELGSPGNRVIGRRGDGTRPYRGSRITRGSIYSQNDAFDVNRDGSFTIDEMMTNMRNMYIPGVGRYRAPRRQGAALNQGSTQMAMASSRQAPVVVNAPQTNVNASSNGGSSGSQNRVPPVRSAEWDGYKEYFGMA